MNSPFAVETAKIVGTPADGCWSQIHTFSPEDEDKKKKRGELLAVLVISGVSEGIESVAVGREILGRFHEEYYGNLEGSAFERLGLAVEKVCQENRELQLIAASILDDVLYLASSGEGRVLLKRGEQLGFVLKEEGKFQTASGILQKDDLLLLGSVRFFEVVAEGTIRAAFASGSPTEAVEVMAPMILGREDMADAAAVLVLVNQDEQISTIPVGEEEEVVDNLRPVGSELPVEKAKEVEQKKEETGKQNLFKKTFGKISFKFLPRLKPRTRIFVRRQERGRKKTIGIVILLLLLASGAFGSYRVVSQRLKENKAEKLIVLAEEKLNQGKQTSLTDPIEGKKLVEEAKKLALEVENLVTKKTDEAKLLKEQAEKFLANLMEGVNLAQVPVLVDLTESDKGISGVSLVKVGNNFLISDPKQKAVYLFNTETKEIDKMDLKQEGDLLAVFKTRAFVFAPEGIYEIDIAKKSFALKIKKDPDWGKIVGLSCFNNNLYLLDQEKGTLWRYLSSGSSFSSKKSWFADSSFTLSDPLSLSIDSSVWILNKDEIEKFNLGKKEDFSLSKSDIFLEPTKIYTSSENQNLYILDKGRGRIFVISKEGEVKNSYFWEEIKQAADLVVDEIENKTYLLSGAKVYEINLQ